jgi:hypothetical protein
VTGIDLQTLKISSSWIAGHGDVIEMGSRGAGGKLIKPRKKRGKPISETIRLDQLHKIERARVRRRGGFDVSRRT